jgi:hypothetical protein
VWQYRQGKAKQSKVREGGRGRQGRHGEIGTIKCFGLKTKVSFVSAPLYE